MKTFQVIDSTGRIFTIQADTFKREQSGWVVFFKKKEHQSSILPPESSLQYEEATSLFAPAYISEGQ